MRRVVSKNFWENVDQSGDCWEWKLGKTPRGYGHLRKNGKQTYAHRVAYELTHGSIPEGLCICHRCDNPPCCNPDHLFAGTMVDNMRDRDAKGRNGAYKNRGKSSSMSTRKSTPEQKAAQSVRTTALFANAENRRRMSEKLKAYFADPANRQRHSDRIQAANKKKSETR